MFIFATYYLQQQILSDRQDRLSYFNFQLKIVFVSQHLVSGNSQQAEFFLILLLFIGTVLMTSYLCRQLEKLLSYSVLIYKPSKCVLLPKRLRDKAKSALLSYIQPDKQATLENAISFYHRTVLFI